MTVLVRWYLAAACLPWRTFRANQWKAPSRCAERGAVPHRGQTLTVHGCRA
jgi:hypothetical protein